MTQREFIIRAVRTAEKALRIPAGWWGTYRDVTDGKRRVRFSPHRGGWVVSKSGKIVSYHDSRTFAIRKAAKL